MHTYLILLRGINVGGKNKISMVTLKLFLEALGCTHVITYIQSGNVILDSPFESGALIQKIEVNLPKKFALDSSLIKIVVLTKKALQQIVNQRPPGFGDEPDKYHSDAIFLIGIKPEQALSVFSPRAGVDKIWPGEGVIYSQRLSSERTHSRLNKIMGTAVYQCMTIRNWNTTMKLLDMLEKRR